VILFLAVTTAADEDDITDCSKCRRIITDVATLPCLDSLCAECFQELCNARSESSADVITCPRCGEQFQLSTDNLSTLSSHGFVGTLMALRKISNLNLPDDNCDICKESAMNSDPVAAAEYFCMECRQRMCAVCSRRHPGCTATKNHNIVGLGLESAKTEIQRHRMKPFTPFCAYHRDNAAVYCCQCSVGLCSQCQTVHSGHELEALTEHTHVQLTNKMKSLGDRLHQVLDECKEKTGRVQKLLLDRKIGMTVAEKKINDKADELVSLVQKQRDDLLNTLHSRNERTISSLDSVSGRLLSALSANKRTARFAEELAEKGSVEDMLLNYRVLNDRVAGLCNVSDISSVPVESDRSVLPSSLIDEVCSSLDSQSTPLFPLLFFLPVFCD